MNTSHVKDKKNKTKGPMGVKGEGTTSKTLEHTHTHQSYSDIALVHCSVGS